MDRRMAVNAGDAPVAQRMKHAAKDIGLHNCAEVKTRGLPGDG